MDGREARVPRAYPGIPYAPTCGAPLDRTCAWVGLGGRRDCGPWSDSRAENHANHMHPCGDGNPQARQTNGTTPRPASDFGIRHGRGPLKSGRGGREFQGNTQTTRIHSHAAPPSGLTPCQPASDPGPSHKLRTSLRMEGRIPASSLVDVSTSPASAVATSRQNIAAEFIAEVGRSAGRRQATQGDPVNSPSHSTMLAFPLANVSSLCRSQQSGLEWEMATLEGCTCHPSLSTLMPMQRGGRPGVRGAFNRTFRNAPTPPLLRV